MQVMLMKEVSLRMSQVKLLVESVGVRVSNCSIVEIMDLLLMRAELSLTLVAIKILISMR